MNFPWLFILDLGIISVALVFSTFLRSKLAFFQRFLVPNALTAGFILLIFYNFAAPLLSLNTDGLGGLVYHLLSISFIAMILRKSPERKTKGNSAVFATAVTVFFQYGLQALIGLLITFLLISTISPELFPAFGFFIPLGFALGPGQAFAIGEGWRSFGFEGGGSVGLTFAAIGFLMASFGGVWLIHYGIRRGWISDEQKERIRQRGIRTGVYAGNEEKPVGLRMATESEAIDPLSFTAAVVLVVYICTYLFLQLITLLLSLAGPLGTDLAVNLWGIHFVFAALMAMAAKKIIGILKIQHTMDNHALTRISGFSVDFMVAAAVGAISLVVVGRYWLPILLMSAVAGFFIFLTVPYFCSRIFTDHRFDRLVIIFGAVTGTMPTGLALLRIIDPDFETPVAADYVLSSAVVFAVCIPFILAINLPAYAHSTGDFSFFWLAVGISLAYTIAGLLAFAVIARKRALRSPGTHWLKEEEE